MRIGYRYKLMRVWGGAGEGDGRGERGERGELGDEADRRVCGGNTATACSSSWEDCGRAPGIS